MRFLLILTLIGMTSISGLAQSSSPTPPPTQNGKNDDQLRQEQLRKQQDDQWLKKVAEQNSMKPLPTDPVKAPPRRPDLPPTSAIKPNKEQAKRLLPAEEDLTRYADFLKQPNTKLIRLFYDLDCTDKYVVRVDNPCLDNIVFSSFYSFRKKSYAEKTLSDLRLKDNTFVTDGLLSNGMLVVLGEVPLESVSLQTGGMKFLVDYQPASKNEEVLTKTEELAKGVRAENHTYAKTAPVLEGMTYAIRVIAYRGQILHPLGNNYFYDELDGDKRMDLIGVFRIIRKDDGNLTLLWKELQRKDAPKIKLSKEEEKNRRFGKIIADSQIGKQRDKTIFLNT